jgi:hypothetical protein
MNLYDMLPFLEGWTQLGFSKQETVEKGKYINVFSRNVKGWLNCLDFASDDAYASCRLTYLGYLSVVPQQYFFTVGGILPPQYGGYAVEYIRPSTLSTAGVYVNTLQAQSSPMPIKGLVRLELGLEADSTQSTATAAVSFAAFEIVDEKAFIKSVRKFMFGWLGWAFDVLSRIPGLKYIGIPKEIKEVVE